VVGGGGLVAIVATELVRPEIYRALAARPWAWPLALLAALGLAGVFFFRARDLPAFLSSSAFLAGTLGATAAGLFPLLLPSTIDPKYSITAAGAAAADHGLRIGLAWWLLGMPLVALYMSITFRSLFTKARAEDH
jgi:cytochrome d ubiquinol oxidase subunit II